MKKKYLFLAGFAAMVLAACSDDVTTDTPTPTPEPEVNENVVPLEIFDGASQQGRLTLSAGTRAAEKWTRLKEVARIAPPTEYTNRNWSATAICFNANHNMAYVTWHSNRQAQEQATVWGGALDVISVADNNEPKDFNVTGINSELKFNNVMLYNGTLFLSATSYKTGATIGRIREMGAPAGNSVECIGFPGSSVNAIAATNNGKLIAVSGYEGTYGTFAADVEAKPWDYEVAENNKGIEVGAPMSETFGGKYVVVDGTNTYILRNNDDEGEILAVGFEDELELGVPLLSEDKSAEDYWIGEDGEIHWGLSEDKKAYYGKHVLAVKGNFAYVGAGQNGLRVYDINKGYLTWNNETTTTGVFVDDDFVYAASGAGLRVYKYSVDGKLELFAFQVTAYENGEPVENLVPGGKYTDEDGNEIDTNPDFHSCNFVTAYEDDGMKYIYVAFGQSGVRVYKLDPNAPAEGDAE